ncbi:MAG: histidine phosphatase family protein [Deltaproteobacteria bacterium]|nr:histidine phosphatase family protein [Deltaproteobacteria bacterium]
MQVTLVRHGESVSNAAGIWQGHSNSPLSARGEAQAEHLAARLKALAGDQVGGPITRILSSDLRRAHDTAQALGSALGLQVQPEPSWREINLGRWEGMTQHDVATQFPEEVAALARGEDIPVGGAERWSDLGRRVGAAFDALADAADEHVLVVAHGGVVITLLSTLFDVMTQRPRVLGKLTNTSLTSLSRHGDRLEVSVYNDALHIDAQASWRREAEEKGRPVVALRAAASGADALDLEPLFARKARAVPLELQAQPEALVAWAGDRLPPGRRASPARPTAGARCLTTNRRPGGTLWTWNEGGGFRAPAG